MAAIEDQQILDPTQLQSGKFAALLLEGVHPTVKLKFDCERYHVISMKRALTEEELKQIIPLVHVVVVGNRSERLTAKVLDKAERLLCIGLSGNDTDQVDVMYATNRGIPVFRDHLHSDSRSVSELVLAYIIMLARQVGDRSMELHRGVWKKTADGCYEVRGKTLGLVGYGHVGSQLGMLAESMGMTVIFYDVLPKLARGVAKSQPSLAALLENSDVVAVNVSSDESTNGMIGEREIAMMRKGSYLINTSRGNVVDVVAAAKALRRGHLAGAAFDVYPDEPTSNCGNFWTPLQGCPNTILTPHIGGSTEEARAAIGAVVATMICDFIDRGSTAGAANVPNISNLRPIQMGHARVLNFHGNQRGVLARINTILQKGNIVSQTLNTENDIGYIVVDVDYRCNTGNTGKSAEEIYEDLNALDCSKRTRVLLP